jgi:hypothetical protein
MALLFFTHFNGKSTIIHILSGQGVVGEPDKKPLAGKIPDNPRKSS